MKGRTLHSVRGSRKGPRGFTLVEMLVVISIIAVLLTIIIGVTNIVLARASTEQTKTNMQIIHQAIDEYRIVKGSYPVEATSSAYPGSDPGPAWLDGSEPVERQRNWDTYCRGKKLYDDLAGEPQSRVFIAKLKKGAIKDIFNGDVFMDGFSKYIEYRSAGGVGGAPVIISAGVDGRFGTEKDIRSDNQ